MPQRFWVNCQYQRKLRSGMTLIELMIVMLISMFVLGAAFSLYQVNARYYVAQDALLEQQQNLRSALYSIARDVRMSGNGFNLMGAARVNIFVNNPAFGETLENASGWFRYPDAQTIGVRPIFGEDGGTDTSDTLTVFHADIETAKALGALAAPFTPGDGSAPITLKEPLIEDMLNDGDMIAVAGGGEVVIVEAGKVTPGVTPIIAIGPRFQPGAALPEASFPAGSTVYRLRDLTLVSYFLGENNRLMANFYSFTDGLPDNPFGEAGGPVVLANDIEDFQVRYILDEQADGTPLNRIADTDTVSEAALDNGRTVRAVRLALVSKSALGNETTSAGRPISVFNRVMDGEPDGYQRRVLTDTVYLRNY